jgi:FkbH-like protein
MIIQIGISAEDSLIVDDNPIEIGSIEEYLPLANRQLFKNNFQHFVGDLKLKGLYLFGNASFNEERKDYYKRQLSPSSKQKQEHLKIDYKYNLFENNPAHIERVIELSSKTNQFNLNKKALNAAELIKYKVFTWDCETQYGPLGVVGFALISDEGVLSNFALSCRALGFGLEHALFNEINSKHRIQSIAFKKTDKNKVAQEFLNTIEGIPLEELS